MFKTISIIIVVLLAGVLTYAATKPDTFRVERSTSVNAPPEKIAPLISDFHSWGGWSPYENKDPNMKRTFSGAQSGNGSVYEWNGNSEVGQGRMEITESSPSKVAIKLDFIKPFEGHDVATFTLAPQGDATIVTWAMDGPNPYLAKVMGVFCNMDHMIGKDFETGLANLKAAAEKQG
jgi:hypothetical protein